MSALLESFVHKTLDALGAERTPLGAEGGGIWRAELSSEAARFLGRAQDDLLYTFDPTRWEEGARLEYLNVHSPLVQRLQNFAIAQGAVVEAHIPADSPEQVYQPFVIARFAARFASDRISTSFKWYGTQLANGRDLPVRHDPFDVPRLIGGKPSGIADDASVEQITQALEGMAAKWNREIDAQTRAKQKDLERRYREEATQTNSAYSDGDQERAIRRIADRLHLKVEADLQMVLILWIAR